VIEPIAQQHTALQRKPANNESGYGRSDDESVCEQVTALNFEPAHLGI
jgi:hypothetical protein